MKEGISLMQKKLETDYAMGFQIGKNMRHFRKEKKITQVELAEICNLTTYIISNIESKQPKEFIPKSHKEILLMNKAELIEYCVAKYNTDPKLYEGMKNKELQAEAEKQ